ncbi:ABC transporter permease subunit [Streptomyces chiangmaiensis]|uniref:ABC transporter permease subunit n=1 Tax=Streptomyces chiangmaiensis TaxID=766497 RepID=A0ABU7FBC9_9ACTN|nr:ABC transporter permease subunit [Streptomyces chiangmaiensis]MED7821466.1 ABC transporter permease subunit [Streptomyces chiangmaiensis]
MTTASAIPAAERGEVTQLRVIRSEWIKLRSLRSTLFTLLAAVVAMVGLGCLFSYFTSARWDHLPPEERLAFDPTLVSLRGLYLAQLAVGVLGVLVVSGEYATGMIRSSLSAVPRRLPVLWAKALVYAAVAWALMTVASLAAFLAGQAALSGRHLGTTLDEPGVLRAVLGAGLYLTVVGLIGVAFGALIRNTAGGIATLFGLLLVLPVLAQALPSSWLDLINPYLPSTAGQGLIHIHQMPHTLAPWTGFAVFCLYALTALAGAGLALGRRDA